VASGATPCIAQLSAWAHANAHAGWGATRVIADTPNGPVGAQVLLHRMHPGHWQRGYAAHGPVGRFADRAAVAAFTAALRAVAHRLDLSHVFIDPELVRDPALEAWLTDEGWHPDPTLHHRTRILDLTASDEELLAGFERRCRQSVHKSERLGVRVVDGTAADLPAFLAIHGDTMRRAGRAAHPEAYLRTLWEELAPAGQARLLFAVAEDVPDPLATMLLVGCGPRLADAYGGTTEAGEHRRANHLLKWEAMRRARAWGYRELDLWGLPNDGVAEFKRAFGGREVEYVGYWTLVTNPVAYRALHAVRDLRGLLHGKPGHRPASGGPEL
jgi:lipid II:glycine glycyltransferase (peptidoglycan interpeptide bridge formation enzyme)